MSIFFEFFRGQAKEPFFDLERGLAGRNTGAVGDTKNMGIDRDCRFAESRVQNDVGCLAADAGQLFEFRPGFRHLAIVVVDQDPAGLDDVFGLVVEQADGFDIGLQAVHAERQ